MALTQQLLLDAERDVSDLAAVVNGDAGDPDVVTRLGNSVKTLQRILAEIRADGSATIAQLGYEPPVAYAAGLNITRSSQTVSNAGEVFAPKVAGLPFVTGALFNAAQWYVVAKVVSVTTRAGLAGVAALPGQAVFLAEASREGQWVWSAANMAAPVAADPNQGRYVAPTFDPSGASGAWVRVINDKIDVRSFGALGGGANDQAAFVAAHTAARALGRKVRWPAGTWEVDYLLLDDDLQVETAGLATKIKQRGGQPAVTPVIDVKSRVKLGDVTVESTLGQVGDSTNEFNHAINIVLTAGATADIRAVEIGNVHGINIRGDIVCIGAYPAAVANGFEVFGITIGQVSGDNCYRNGVSITSGRCIRIESAEAKRCGLYALDLETDVGSGQIIDVWVGRVRGRFLGLGGTTAADYLERIRIDSAELDHGFSAVSDPPYPVTLSPACQWRNIKDLTFGSLVIKGGYPGVALSNVGGSTLPKQVIRAGRVEISGCNTANNVVTLIGGGSGTEWNFENLTVTTETANSLVLSSVPDVHIDRLNLKLINGSAFCNDVDRYHIGYVNCVPNGAGPGGGFMLGARSTIVLGGNVTADYLCGYGCMDTELVGVTANCGLYVVVPTRLTLRKVNLGGTRYELLYYAASSTARISITEAGATEMGALNLNGASLSIQAQQVVSVRGAALPAVAVDLPTAIARINAIADRGSFAAGGHGLWP